MKFSSLNHRAQTITDDDIIRAMEKISGYLDITPSDFMEIYLVAFDHAVSRLKDAIKADQIMTRQVITVHRDAPLIDVVKKMAGHQISGLPVIEENQTVSGVISEKDFLKRMNDEKAPSFMRVVQQCLETTGCIAADFKKLTAADIMTSPPIVTGVNVSVIEVAGMMDQHNINRVPILDEQFKLVGIIARSDLVQMLC